jgi:hypothetical protein
LSEDETRVRIRKGGFRPCKLRPEYFNGQVMNYETIASIEKIEFEPDDRFIISFC